MSRPIAVIAAALFLLVAAVPAGATGTVRIQQNDGSADVYNNVAIHIVDNKALTLTSPDGKGVMTIDRAACSMVDNLLRCLLYSISITDHGQTKPLDFAQGTLFLNKTGERQQMTHSSQTIPPKGVLIALRTKIGTYISVSGTVDGGLK